MTGPRMGNTSSIRQGRRWASDCDALSKHGYDHESYVRHLGRLQAHQATCAFVVVPDVPGDGAATLSAYLHYAPLMASDGFPLAYCLQDGAEHLELPPCDVAFLGGTDAWRAAQGAWLLQEAHAAGCRTHVGRVNSARRMRHLTFCHADSCDGTYVGYRGVERGLREIGQWLSQVHTPSCSVPLIFRPRGDQQARCSRAVPLHRSVFPPERLFSS
ncbi:hypothetical protein ACFP90_21890 [Deinococcus multiflagellatus]|uniref:GNAT family N-acetyltransferase n=1 Tax=Deinococcus multiflagellatus TaxID=1656887 RepID=A0ABW1ZT70_9DEIO